MRHTKQLAIHSAVDMNVLSYSHSRMGSEHLTIPNLLDHLLHRIVVATLLDGDVRQAPTQSDVSEPVQQSYFWSLSSLTHVLVAI